MIICQNCGEQIPDDSEFCQYCGSRIVVPEEQQHPTETTISELAETLNEQATTPVSDALDVDEHIEHIDKEALNPASDTRQSKKGWKIVFVCSFICLLGSLILNVYQFVSAKNNTSKIAELTENADILKGTVDTLEKTIEDLNASIEKKTEEIKEKTSKISGLKDRVASLETDSKAYKTIVDVAKKGNLGYASSNFKSSESVIVLEESEKNRNFALTAYWTDGGTVSIDYDTWLPAAYVDFAQDSWNTSTTMKVEPYHTGLTVVTFSNDVDGRTFDIIIVVE